MLGSLHTLTICSLYRIQIGMYYKLFYLFKNVTKFIALKAIFICLFVIKKCLSNFHKFKEENEFIKSRYAYSLTNTLMYNIV